MKENIIEFKGPPIIFGDKDLHPDPALLHIPKWYKDVPNPDSYVNKTIKSCKPFLDSLLAGYILKNTHDQIINFNVYHEEHKKTGTWIEVKDEIKNFKHYNNINTGGIGKDAGNEFHPLSQIGGMTCPYAKKNLGFPIYKLLNPWTISLPKGYSVLILPPINRPDDRFEILSGIVDNGVDMPTNFPCVFKKQGTWVLKKGTPLATIFPFKREKWKSKISKKTIFEHELNIWKYASIFKNWYEKLIWNKKSWK
jgi:hypothetical protein